MNGESANKFISALVKSLQTLCQGYVEFNDGIEIIGHLYLNIDSGSSFDYIVKEKVCKGAENSTVFVSKSYAAQSPPGELVTRKDKGHPASDFEDSISPLGTSRLQSAITSISNVLSGTQNQKPRLLSLDQTTHSPAKRKREHNGNYSSMQPPYKYANLQSSSSSSAYFNNSSKPVDRNHTEHFSSTSHAEFFGGGGDSNQSSGMGPDDEDDLDLDVTFVKAEYSEGQRYSSQRGVSAAAASRLSQDPASSQSAGLHEQSNLSGQLYGSTSNVGQHQQAPQQFTSGTASDLPGIGQAFQDTGQLDMAQHGMSGPPNPRTSATAVGEPVLLSTPTPHASHQDIQEALSLSLNDPARVSSVVVSKDHPFVHTVRQTKWAVNKAKEWLTSQGMSTDFEGFSDTELNKMLTGFYTMGQKRDGARFSATALLAFRTAISRYLNKCGRNLSIASSHAFKESNAILSRLQSTAVKVNKCIELKDIKLMYTSGALSNFNAESLLYKVWFELQMHFRAKLNWCEVRAEDFFFSCDSSGKVTVTWDTRGYGTCEEMTTFEGSGDQYCPARSLRAYLDCRCQESNAFLQMPASSGHQAKGQWYLPEELTEHKERQFMKKISTKAGLSQAYTNGCVLNSVEEYFEAIRSLGTGPRTQHSS